MVEIFSRVEAFIGRIVTIHEKAASLDISLNIEFNTIIHLFIFKDRAAMKKLKFIIHGENRK